MIYIRDDDFLMHSRAFINPLERFKEVHSLICKYNNYIHVPAIICNSVKEFPGAVDFLKKELELNRIKPQIHGWDHIDYGRLSFTEIIENLKNCLDWFLTNLNYRPLIFYTPWAAESEIISKASRTLGLTAVGGKRNFKEPHNYLNLIYPLDDECTIALHWWKNSDIRRLKRILEGEIK